MLIVKIIILKNMRQWLTLKNVRLQIAKSLLKLNAGTWELISGNVTRLLLVNWIENVLIPLTLRCVADVVITGLATMLMITAVVTNEAYLLSMTVQLTIPVVICNFTCYIDAVEMKPSVARVDIIIHLNLSNHISHNCMCFRCS